MGCRLAEHTLIRTCLPERGNREPQSASRHPSVIWVADLQSVPSFKLVSQRKPRTSIASCHVEKFGKNGGPQYKFSEPRGLFVCHLVAPPQSRCGHTFGGAQMSKAGEAARCCPFLLVSFSAYSLVCRRCYPFGQHQARPYITRRPRHARHSARHAHGRPARERASAGPSISASGERTYTPLAHPMSKVEYIDLCETPVTVYVVVKICGVCITNHLPGVAPPR